MWQKQVVGIHKPLSRREADLPIYDCRKDRTSFSPASAALLDPTQQLCAAEELTARTIMQTRQKRQTEVEFTSNNTTFATDTTASLKY